MPRTHNKRVPNLVAEAQRMAQDIRANGWGIRVEVVETTEDALALLPNLEPFDIVVVASDLDTVIVKTPQTT